MQSSLLSFLYLLLLEHKIFERNLRWKPKGFFFSFVVLGFELRAYTLSHSTSPFLGWGFFKIGSHELFAQAGFELQSS
jgi:hypothetical protein